MVERRDDPAVERPGRLEGHRDAGSCVMPAFSEDSDRQADRQADDRDATGAYIAPEDGDYCILPDVRSSTGSGLRRRSALLLSVGMQ